MGVVKRAMSSEEDRPTRSFWRDVTDTGYDDPTPVSTVVSRGMWKHVLTPFIQGICLGVGQYGAKMFFDEWTARRAAKRALTAAQAVSSRGSGGSGPREA